MKMRSLSILMCLVLVMACTSCMRSNTATTSDQTLLCVEPQKHIHVLQSELKLLKTDQPKSRLINFDLNNSTNSARSLVLKGRSCSCFGVSVDGTILEDKSIISIPPHSMVNVAVEHQSINSASEHSYGLVFQSSDNENDIIKLNGKLTCHADFEVSSPAIICDFKENQKNSTKTLTVTSSSRSKDGLVTSINFRDLPIGVQLKEIKSRKPVDIIPEIGIWQQVFEVEFDIQPVEVLDKSSWNDTFVLVANNKSELVTEKVLSLRRNRTYGLSFPTTVQFGEVPLNSSQSRRIFIESVDGKLFHIIGHDKIKNGFFDIDYDSHEYSKRHWLTIKFNPAIAGTQLHKLVFNTDHVHSKNFEIDVEGKATSE